MCNDETGFVEMLSMGANNVIHPPPKQFFSDLPHLRSIDLFSNPLNSFDFEGISEATRLETLILDTTGISSVKGIGNAPALTSLNLRFNLITDADTISEISNLKRLESLDLGDNLLEGSITSEFDDMSNLHRLNLGRNRLKGSLPSLAYNTHLKHVDLSFNQFTGSIPDTFMELAAATVGLSIDLSSNKLTGQIPLSLARFDGLNIFLRDNQLESMDEIICSQKGWNEGDVGEFGCSSILCPSGTYSDIGRQSDGFNCVQCPDSQTMGAIKC